MGKLSADQPITAPAYSDRRQTAASRRVDAPASEVLAPPRSGGAANRDGTQEAPSEMLTPTHSARRPLRQKSIDARRRCFDRYLSSGLGGSQRRLCRGQRQSWQSGRRKSCGQNGDAEALCGLSKPLQGAVPLSQLVPERPVAPVLIAAGEPGMCLLEFFAANIHNPHTRRTQRQATARPDPPPGFDWFVTGRVVPANRLAQCA
jgi:hypothetical protein